MPAESSQVYLSFDETTRVACPRLATSERIAATGADRAIVTAFPSAAAYVAEWSAVDADFQYAAVEPVLKKIVVPESQNPRSDGIDRSRR
jgi:hypothetical protein